MDRGRNAEDGAFGAGVLAEADDFVEDRARRGSDEKGRFEKDAAIRGAEVDLTAADVNQLSRRVGKNQEFAFIR
jgi:hypothetical protein